MIGANMDVTQSLKDTENSLRDFIAYVLSSRYGAGWEEKCGVTDERLNRWKERKEIETKRHVTSAIDERLIYYSDFYDLKTILKKHWDSFAPIFGEFKKFEVLLGELEKYRDSDAHRRELLPHQKNLVLGISGEIRANIVKYRSQNETSEDYFPRIESVRDNFGNGWVPGKNDFNHVATETILRPGDDLQFVITATDPEDRALQYCCRPFLGKMGWQSSHSVSLRVEAKDIAKMFQVEAMIISNRDYHAGAYFDDRVTFAYTVLPNKPK